MYENNPLLNGNNLYPGCIRAGEAKTGLWRFYEKKHLYPYGNNCGYIAFICFVQKKITHSRG